MDGNTEPGKSAKDLTHFLTRKQTYGASHVWGTRGKLRRGVCNFTVTLHARTTGEVTDLKGNACLKRHI